MIYGPFPLYPDLTSYIGALGKCQAQIKTFGWLWCCATGYCSIYAAQTGTQGHIALQRHTFLDWKGNLAEKTPFKNASNRHTGSQLHTFFSLEGKILLQRFFEDCGNVVLTDNGLLFCRVLCFNTDTIIVSTQHIPIRPSPQCLSGKNCFLTLSSSTRFGFNQINGEYR